MAIQVSPKNVVGRDQLIDRIWKRLRSKSIRFTAERRVGKTTVMTKMAAEPRPGFEVLFMELEGIDSPERFVELLLNRVRPLLSGTAAAKSWLNTFRESIGGTEVAGVFKLPNAGPMAWRVTLTKTLEGVCQHQPDRTILLLLDELPYMLQKIGSLCSNGKKTEALTLLDSLRSIRQQFPNVRMVYAGSVGLHHVITDLKQGVLASEPTNEMPLVEIRELDEPYAITLAKRLLDDEGVQLKSTDEQAILQRLVSLTDGVPFYIEAVCSRLGESDDVVDVPAVESVVRKQLSSDHDPWEMEHFRSRLSIYYSGTIDDTTGTTIRDEQLAREILDHLAITNAPQSIDQVWATVTSKFQIADRQHIVQMLKWLALDHYLISDEAKRYSFRFPLIRKWWLMAQGLIG